MTRFSRPPALSVCFTCALFGCVSDTSDLASTRTPLTVTTEFATGDPGTPVELDPPQVEVDPPKNGSTSVILSPGVRLAETLVARTTYDVVPRAEFLNPFAEAKLTPVHSLPGALLVESGETCENNIEPDEGSIEVDLPGSYVLPDFANEATVFLSGFHLEYFRDDHHVAGMKVAIEEIWRDDDTLRWRARGFLRDHNADDSFKFCYIYTVMAWNTSRIDAGVRDGDDAANHTEQVSPRSFPAFSTHDGVLERGTRVLLPRGHRMQYEDQGHDAHLLQTAWWVDSIQGSRVPGASRSVAIFKDEDIAFEPFVFEEWVSAFGGRDVELIEPSFAPPPLVKLGADGCFAIVGYSDEGLPIFAEALEVTDHVVEGLPFEFAVPVLTGWNLHFPTCNGDQHVREARMVLANVSYQKDPRSPTGTLRYQIISSLRDKDDRPGHFSDQRVSIVGLRAPLLEWGDAEFFSQVGSVATTPTVRGFVRNTGGTPVTLTTANNGGVANHEFLIQLRYFPGGGTTGTQPFYAPDIARSGGLELLPGDEVSVEGWYAPEVPAPRGGRPEEAWVTFETDHHRYSPIQVFLRGHTP